MDNNPKTNYERITNEQAMTSYHFRNGYGRWLEESYKEMLEILCECFRDDMVNDLEELLRIIEKRTGRKWEELDE